MSASRNPFLELDGQGVPLLQLKQSLVLYLDYPPGPRRARAVYDAYMERFGSYIRVFQSTSWLGPPLEWSATARAEFEASHLPRLKSGVDWGYAFTDGCLVDHHLFMFHGYRPASEPGKASFFRFEWPWDFDSEEVALFAAELADLVPFLSGTGGFILSPRPYDGDAHDRMFALAWRYWGLEAWNLDVTVNHALGGYKCPGWITLIGARLLQRSKGTVNLEAVAPYATAKRHGTLYRSRPLPALIDRNRAEPYDGERVISLALLPLQIEEHAAFGGTRWTDDNTVEWLRRFSR